MIAYTMVGTKDLARSIRFYEPLFAAMGFSSCWKDELQASWGDPSDDSVPRFFTGTPFNEKPATVGNGVMTAFGCDDAASVDRLYAIAMQNGAWSEGEPGLRPQYGEGFYAAYVRDPDGNKLAFVCYRASNSS